MTGRTIKTLKHYYKYHSSDRPRCTQNKIKMHIDGTVTINPRQRSNCSDIMTNGVKLGSRNVVSNFVLRYHESRRLKQQKTISDT